MMADCHLSMTLSDLSLLSSRPDPSVILECRELSQLGEYPATWCELNDDTLRQVAALKLLEYGTTEDRCRIPGLMVLYRYLMERIPVSGRLEMLREFRKLVQAHQGLGQMGLEIFLAADTDPGIRAAASRHFEANDKIQPSADSA